MMSLDTQPDPMAFGQLIQRPIILVGAGGMLYRAWDNLLHKQQIAFRGLGIAEMDLTKPATIPSALGDSRLVINCAAYTNVDGAEKEPALADAINGVGVGHLARQCRQIGALLVHYSTDYVFGGDATHPYRTTDARRPLGAYGRSKALGEELIEQSGCQFLLVRTSWLYAPWANNFVRTIVRLTNQGGPLKIVDDQFGRPTSAEHLAATTLELVQRGGRGIYHVTDGGECNWFDFARQIAGAIDPTVPVNPCSSAQMARPAARPAYSVLDLSKTEALLGPMPHWKINLADVMGRLEFFGTPSKPFSQNA